MSGVSHGLGISNIRQRLKALYKDNSSLETGDDGNLFKATLTIPLF